MLKSEKLRVTTIAAAASALAAVLAVVVLWGARPAEAAFPGSNGKIAFSSEQSILADDPSTTDSEIFTMNPDGTDLTQLTRNDADDEWPSWQPIVS